MGDAQVNPAIKLEDAYCLDCEQDEVFVDVKEGAAGVQGWRGLQRA